MASKQSSKAAREELNPIEQLSKLVTSAVESASATKPIIRRRSARVRENNAARNNGGSFEEGHLTCATKYRIFTVLLPKLLM